MIAHLRRLSLTVAVIMCLVLTMVLVVPAEADAIVTILPLRTIVVVSAPSNLTATANGTSIALSWKDNSSNESGFEIERKSAGSDFSKITTVAAGTTSYTDSGLTAGVQYTYRVRAVNSSASSSYSNEAAATTSKPLIRTIQPTTTTTTTSTVPSVPANLNAQALSESEVLVSWSDQSTNESGFRLERKDAAQGYAEIAVLSANTTTYKDKGLQENTIYSYRIRSFNASGTSNYSSEATVQTPESEANTSGTTIINNNTTNINNTTNTTNNANTNTNISGSTISNSNIASNNQTSQTTDVSNENALNARTTMSQYVNVLVNGQQLQSDVRPFVNEDGRTMLPVRAIAEALGVQVQWDGATQTAILTQGIKTVQVPIGQQAITVNGSQVPIDTSATIKEGRTMLPVRAVGEAFGAQIGWDGSTRTVSIDA